MTLYDAASRFEHGTGPLPSSLLPSCQPETTICGSCGMPVWNDWRAAQHVCKPRKATS